MSNLWDSTVLVRFTHSYEPLHREGQGHVGGGAEGHRGHGVEEVHVQEGQESWLSKQLTNKLEGGVGVDRNIEHDVPEHDAVIAKLGINCNFKKV